MHFSIPDTQNLNEGNGSTTYIGYNIHINGAFHSTVRYKQLHNLHDQLKKAVGNKKMPYFPSKKILPLSSSQLEERRSYLEKYIQIVGQDSRLSSSELLIGFLLSAQQETAGEKKQDVFIDIYIMNDIKVSIKIGTCDRTDQVLMKICKHIKLPLDLMQYFSLYEMKLEKNEELVLYRKLLNFEAPYMSQKLAKESNKIFLRKNYWDIEYDFQLMKDPVALNLLYAQTVTEVEKEWIFCTREIKIQLENLQTKVLKKEYVELAQPLKNYGFIHFKPCFCNYPKPNTKVLMAIGNEVISMRVGGADPSVGKLFKELTFRVTRMRCWRVVALHNKMTSSAEIRNSNNNSDMEFSFEYLMTKEKLQWITVTSDQAMLMSVCLQSLVDELLMKKNGRTQKQAACSNKGTWSYMKRDGSSQLIDFENDNENNRSENNETVESNVAANDKNLEPSNSQDPSVNKLQKAVSNISFRTDTERELIENHAFEGIGDDDL